MARDPSSRHPPGVPQGALSVSLVPVRTFDVMQSLRPRIWALAVCLVAWPHVEAEAQNSPIQSQIRSRTSDADAADEITSSISQAEGNEKYLVVPVPIIDPTIGNGLAVVGLVTFAVETDGKAEPMQPRSTLAIAAGYTNTDSRMVGGGLQLFLGQDRYRVSLGAGYGNLNLKWYGTSSDSPFFDNPIDFRTRGVLVDGKVQSQVAQNFYLGVSGRYVRPEAKVKVPIDVLPDLKAEFNLSEVGMIGEYDTRDSTWYPETGSLGTINLLSYLEALGSDREFGSLETTYAHYRKLAEPLVLAVQARVATVGDNTPFFMLSTINLRGFPVGQYINRNVTQLQGELRWEVWRRVGIVLFGGTGVAAKRLDDWSDADRAYGCGTGLRYRLSEVDKMNVGLDVASGSTSDFTIYFRIGEVF